MANDLFKNYSHEQIMQMYEQLKNGETPAELSSVHEKYTDENGNPIIDPEGGAII